MYFRLQNKTMTQICWDNTTNTKNSLCAHYILHQQINPKYVSRIKVLRIKKKSRKLKFFQLNERPWTWGLTL